MFFRIFKDMYICKKKKKNLNIIATVVFNRFYINIYFTNNSKCYVVIILLEFSLTAYNWSSQDVNYPPPMTLMLETVLFVFSCVFPMY